MKLRAEGDTLQNCTKAYLASRAAVRVCFFLWSLFPCSSLWGRASAPTGCSPRVSGWLLSRKPGTPIDELWVLTFCLKRLTQDYDNLRVTAFNRNVEELGKRTADLAESRSESFPLFSSLRGHASAPAGCSPRDSGRLLSSRAGSPRRPTLLMTVVFLSFLQGPTLLFNSS